MSQDKTTVLESAFKEAGERLGMLHAVAEGKHQPTIPFWPWQIVRHFRAMRRDMEVRHAKERAALATWEIECHYVLREVGYE